MAERTTKTGRTKKNINKAIKSIFPDRYKPFIGKGYENERNTKGNLSPNVLILYFFANSLDTGKDILNKILNQIDNILEEKNFCVQAFIPNIKEEYSINKNAYMEDWEEYNFRVNHKNYLELTEDHLEQYCNLLLESITLLHPDIILILGKPLSKQLHRAFSKRLNKVCIFPYDFDEKFNDSNAFIQYCLNKNITSCCIDDQSFFDKESPQIDKECIEFLKKETFHHFYSIISNSTKQIISNIDHIKNLALLPKKERTYTTRVFTNESKKKTKEIKKDELIVEIDHLKKDVVQLQKLTIHALNKENTRFQSKRIKTDGTIDLRCGKGKAGKHKEKAYIPND